ncbi:sortase-associated OmpA-like protein PdsO [Lacimicrobium sp. SS2-24]|uniref:sortase-associated OmpA-like protein PdsO n=1 Tax=Lacimicrobium sp. SS2-24 TaxID=2005569 RepID=UPI000B4C0301|nr:sortase-associated OmpA-like protein PdsO [Lacimicrobium sp. SS2-24]
MKKLMITTAIVTALSAPVAVAAEKDIKQAQNIGFGSGLVLGAVTAGPVGAIVGGVTGLFIGNSVGADKEMKQLNAALNQHEAEINQLLAANQTLLTQLRSAQEENHMQMASMNNAALLDRLPNLSMNVQFRTGSASLESIYQQQLDELAKLLNNNKALRVELTGHADRRGDASYNKRLSSQRIDSVKQQLLAKGISENRIQSQALGASKPLDPNPSLDGNAFDRRVVVTLNAEGTQTAANR